MSTVRVVAKGKTYEEKLSGDTTKLTQEQIIEKYKHNAVRILTQDKINISVNAFMTLEKVKNISDLVEQITL
jgi:hypothetical protein